jgi:hypothetical protein
MLLRLYVQPVLEAVLLVHRFLFKSNTEFFVVLSENLQKPLSRFG